MNGKAHAIVSALAGGIVYGVQGSMTSGLAVFLSGTLIDADHLLDFYLFSGEKFTAHNFISWCDDGRWKKITLIFHSYEFLTGIAVISIITGNILLTSICLGAGIHLVLDQVWNCFVREKVALRGGFYFIVFRAVNGFRREGLIRKGRNGLE